MSFNPELGIAMTESQYLDNWILDSAAMDAVGAYQWMASLLPAASHVLEVGCGSGRGTLALVSSGRKVTAFESNPHALAHTEAYLASNGISVARVTTHAEAVGRPENVVLIGQDFLAAAPGISSNLGIDAIACWNIGGAPSTVAGASGLNPATMKREDVAAYRPAVQRACYKLAARAMPPGGIVHVVDRTAIIMAHKGAALKQLTQAQKALAVNTVLVDASKTVLWPYAIPASHLRYLAAQPIPPDATRALGSTLASAT